MITIGIPAFNGGDKFRMALASAVANKNLIEQILVVDDGNNRDILSGFNDSRIVYYQNQSRLYMWKNFLKALRLSNTQYFSWLADDDFISPSLGSAVSLAVRHNPEAVAYMGIPTTHAPNRGSKPARCLILPSKETSSYNRILDVFGSNSYGALFYSVFDRNKISMLPLELLCEYPSKQYSYDYVWMMHIAIQGSIAYIPEQLYFYDQSNWDDPKKDPISSLGLLLDKGLVYLLGILISFFSYNTFSRRKSESNSERYARRKTWGKILSMTISKYILRSARSEFGASPPRTSTLALFIHSLASTIDANRGLDDNAVLIFAQDLIIKISSDIELSALLAIPISRLVDPVWSSFPDYNLYKRKTSLLALGGVRALKSLHLTSR